VPDDGWMAGARLQGIRSSRAKLAGQRISCSFLWVGWALAKGVLTDYITYITCTVQCFTGGMVDIRVHTYLRAVKTRKRGYSSWVDTTVLFSAVRKHRVT
jgi:hypothetical protein